MYLFRDSLTCRYQELDTRHLLGIYERGDCWGQAEMCDVHAASDLLDVSEENVIRGRAQCHTHTPCEEDFKNRHCWLLATTRRNGPEY